MPSITNSRRGRRAGLLCATAVAVVSLSGCAGIYPGSAASVDGQTISRSQVDDLARIRCDLQSTSTNAQPVAYSTLLQSTVDILITSSLQLKYAATQHVSYDAREVNQQMGQFADQLGTTIPAGDRTTLLQAAKESVEGNSAMRVLGAKLLSQQGQRVTTDLAYNVGNRMMQKWRSTVDVQVDPRYDVGTSGNPGGGDGSISSPVSSFALQTLRASSDPGVLSSYPKNQVCGG